MNLLVSATNAKAAHVAHMTETNGNQYKLISDWKTQIVWNDPTGNEQVVHLWTWNQLFSKKEKKTID